MYILRQMLSTVVEGAPTNLYSNPVTDYKAQVQDPPSRYIMLQQAPGQESDNTTILASGSSFSIPLPPGLVAGQMLHCALSSTQTVTVTVTDTVLGSSTVMLQAGSASDQPGQYVWCGETTAITVNNTSANQTTLYWMLFQLPPITLDEGWRDGSQATGTVDYTNDD